MPGVHLNDIEKRLKKKWDDANAFKNPLLGISIKGQNASLRGISDLIIEFKYPVTVICGKNGVGKTTILSLATLAFNGDKNFQPRGTQGGRRYYTFSDFFYKGPQDSDCHGIEIKWTYKSSNGIRITKRSKKWMRYERRPKVAVQYLGASRIISAMEQRVLRSHFKPGKTEAKSQISSLNEKFLGYLSSVLSREYSQAEELSHKTYHLRVCSTTATYSSFNMGAGEDVLINLLSLIQSMPDNSLCVIEEIELGIHPEALGKLAEVLQAIAMEKRMQFIISSHSEAFIDNLPREARILLCRREASENHITHKLFACPTTRFAMGEISLRSEPEMRVYCEDSFAKEIIQRALPNSVRKRIEVIAFGSKSEFKNIYKWHCLTSKKMKHLLVWDGDVTDQEVNEQLNGVEGVNYCFLHSNGNPERNVIEAIYNSSEGIERCISSFRFEDKEETKSLLCQILSLEDSHNFGYELSQKTGLSEVTVSEKLLEIYASIADKELKKLSDIVELCLSNTESTWVLGNHNR